MTPLMNGKTMTHARRLMRLGAIHHDTFLVFEHLMWGAGRLPFADEVERSYAEICTAVRVCRQVVARAVKQLEAVGLIQKTQQHVLVTWTRGKRWAQRANLYRFLPVPDCEFARQPDSVREDKRKKARGLYNTLLHRLGPQPPVRSVAEQIAFCLGQ